MKDIIEIGGAGYGLAKFLVSFSRPSLVEWNR